ncbi:hypothetical protein [Micromonospora sediminicola]|uniref:hypothetical protein n=1 Tax=Micromonospora sediminicola TaxID=946078 RepID=UPI003796DCE4
MSIHDDCAYWGLTWSQCARYHLRLANYYSRRSVAEAASSARAARVTAVALALIVAAQAVAVGVLLGALLA